MLDQYTKFGRNKTGVLTSGDIVQTGDVWENQDDANHTLFINELKQRLADYCIAKLNMSRYELSKLKYYNMYTTEYYY